MCRSATEPRWYTLMRRAAGEDVAGRVQLAFQWDITARGLLALKLQALERVPSIAAFPSLPLGTPFRCDRHVLLQQHAHCADVAASATGRCSACQAGLARGIP